MAKENRSTLCLRYEGLVEVMAAFKQLRGPILASIAAAVVLAIPDQIREVYRIYAADRDWGNIASAAVALVIMSVCFWWVAFRIAHAIPDAFGIQMAEPLPATFLIGNFNPVRGVNNANGEFREPSLLRIGWHPHFLSGRRAAGRAGDPASPRLSMFVLSVPQLHTPIG